MVMTVYSCPECRKSVSDQAKLCPHCGLPIDSEQITKMKAAVNQQLTFTGVAFGGFFLLLLVICSGVFSSPSRAREDYTLAEQLGVIEGNSDSSSVQQYDRSLKLLSRRFSESESLIASKTIRAQEILASKGVNCSLNQIMAEMEYVTDDGTLGISYAEMLSTQIALKTTP